MAIPKTASFLPSKPFKAAGFIVTALLAAGFMLCQPNAVKAGETVLKLHPKGEATVIGITEDQVRALPPVTITTFDPWDNKERTYTGCLLSAFLEKQGLSDFDLIQVTAVNDYQAKITKAFLAKYDYLLTYAMDGKDYAELGEDNKGPLAIAVKYESIEAADKIKVKNHMVWWIDQIRLY